MIKKATNTLTKDEQRKLKHEAIDYLKIVELFEMEEIKLQIFEFGNDHFKALVKEDLKDINSGKQTHRPVRSQDEASLGGIRSLNNEDLNLLFEAKYKIVNDQGIHNSREWFASDLKKSKEYLFIKHFERFPVLKQWFAFLENYRESKEKNNNDSSNGTETGKKRATEIFKKEHIKEGKKYLKNIDIDDQRKIGETYSYLRYSSILKIESPKKYIEYFNNLNGTAHGEKCSANCSSIFSRLNKKTVKNKTEQEAINKLNAIFGL